MTFPTIESAPEGRAFRSSNWPADSSILTVAADGVAVTVPTGTRWLPVSGAEALYVFPDGLRTLIGRDGWALSIEPARWQRGQEAVAELDRLLPGDLHLPQPALDRPLDFEPAPFARRWWLYLQRKDYFWLLTALVLTPLVVWISSLVAAQLAEPQLQLIVRAAPGWVVVLGLGYFYNKLARGRR
jgi:hypothetical protein